MWRGLPSLPKMMPYLSRAPRARQTADHIALNQLQRAFFSGRRNRRRHRWTCARDHRLAMGNFGFVKQLRFLFPFL
jgi:hypothetical protein